MKTSLIHNISAHPVIVSWVVGAVAINGTLLMAVSHEAPLNYVFSDTKAALLYLLGTIAAILLGYFAGMFAIWPLMRPLCTKLNGGPLQEGDQVCVLSGPHMGVIASVKKRVAGQGGWKVAVLEFGEQHRGAESDVVEEFMTLRISKRQ